MKKEGDLMSSWDILNMYLEHNFSISAFVIFILLTMIQISPIKWNPWDSIFSWFGKKINKNISDQLNETNKNVKSIQEELDEHIQRSRQKEIDDTRNEILDFANACMNHRRHTQEQFKFIISQCDKYELYMEQYRMKNGVITSAITEIKTIYQKCIQENSFLKGDEYSWQKDQQEREKHEIN
jgi:hypothetical protein